MADTIDFELDRSGRYVPAVVSGTYSFIDKIITAFSAVIATTSIMVVGYTHSLPPAQRCPYPRDFLADPGP